MSAKSDYLKIVSKQFKFISDYWIYNLDFKSWKEYSKEYLAKDREEYFIASDKYFNVKKNQHILFFVKSDGSRSKSSFVGYGKVYSEFTKNSNRIRVFRDPLKNVFISEINDINILDNPYDLTNIIARVSGTSSVQKFSSNYCKGSLTINNLDSKIGREILKVLHEQFEEELLNEKMREQYEKENSDSDDNETDKSDINKENEYYSSSDSSDEDTNKYSEKSNSTTKSNKSTSSSNKKNSSTPSIKSKSNSSTCSKKSFISNYDYESDDSENYYKNPNSDSNKNLKKITIKQTIKETIYEEKEYYSSDSEIDESEKSNKSQKNKKVSIKNLSDDGDFDNDNDDNDEYNYDEENLEDNEHKNGLIPIVIELCPKILKFLDSDIEHEDETKNILNHIYYCQKCNIVNNNEIETSKIFDRAEISFNIVKKSRADMYLGVEAYQNLEKFDFFCDEVEIPMVSINYIKDKTDDYFKCLLIFITVPEDYGDNYINL